VKPICKIKLCNMHTFLFVWTWSKCADYANQVSAHWATIQSQMLCTARLRIILYSLYVIWHVDMLICTIYLNARRSLTYIFVKFPDLLRKQLDCFRTKSEYACSKMTLAQYVKCCSFVSLLTLVPEALEEQRGEIMTKETQCEIYPLPYLMRLRIWTSHVIGYL
jgi:hypothetical protein